MYEITVKVDNHADLLRLVAHIDAFKAGAPVGPAIGPTLTHNPVLQTTGYSQTQAPAAVHHDQHGHGFAQHPAQVQAPHAAPSFTAAPAAHTPPAFQMPNGQAHQPQPQPPQYVAAQAPQQAPAPAQQGPTWQDCLLLNQRIIQGGYMTPQDALTILVEHGGGPNSVPPVERLPALYAALSARLPRGV